ARAAGDCYDGGSRVVGFDFSKKRAVGGLHADDITEKPEEQVDGVNALIDQGAAAVEREGAAPAGIGVVLRRTIPLHAGVDDERSAKEALIQPGLELANMRLHAVLKNHAKLDAGFFCSVDEGIGARGGEFGGVLREDVKEVTGSGE